MVPNHKQEQSYGISPILSNIQLYLSRKDDIFINSSTAKGICGALDKYYHYTNASAIIAPQGVGISIPIGRHWKAEFLF